MNMFYAYYDIIKLFRFKKVITMLSQNAIKLMDT